MTKPTIEESLKGCGFEIVMTCPIDGCNTRVEMAVPDTLKLVPVQNYWCMAHSRELGKLIPLESELRPRT